MADAFFVLDNDIPLPPVINNPSSGLTVSGQGEVDATVSVITQSNATCSSLVDSQGSWTCDLSPEPVDDEPATGTQSDLAGNISEPALANIAYRPDLSVSMSNCIDGAMPQQPIMYELTVNNLGNIDINGALLSTLFNNQLLNVSWECFESMGSTCDGITGTGSIDDESVSLTTGSSLTYLISAESNIDTMQLIEVTASITLPLGTTEYNPNDNLAVDDDLIYQFIFKSPFECAAPSGSETN